MSGRRKVFCIGFHETGTSALKSALTRLGYRVTGPNGTKDPEIAQKLHRVTKRLSEEYEAFVDNPWPLVYRQMDELHPDARFILSVREAKPWIDSLVARFGDKSTPMRELVYGTGCGAPLGNEALYRETVVRHNGEVKEYFASRPGHLLVVDLYKGGGWPEICGFLGHVEPTAPFPSPGRTAGAAEGGADAAAKATDADEA